MILCTSHLSQSKAPQMLNYKQTHNELPQRHLEYETNFETGSPHRIFLNRPIYMILFYSFEQQLSLKKDE